MTKTKIIYDISIAYISPVDYSEASLHCPRVHCPKIAVTLMYCPKHYRAHCDVVVISGVNDRCRLQVERAWTMQSTREHGAQLRRKRDAYRRSVTLAALPDPPPSTHSPSSVTHQQGDAHRAQLNLTRDFS